MARSKVKTKAVEEKTFLSADTVKKMWEAGKIQVASKEFALALAPVLIATAVNFTIGWVIDKNTTWDRTIDVGSD